MEHYGQHGKAVMKWLLAILTTAIQIAIIFLILYNVYQPAGPIAVLLILSICGGLFITYSNKIELKRGKGIAFGLLAGTGLTVSMIWAWIMYFFIHRYG